MMLLFGWAKLFLVYEQVAPEELLLVEELLLAEEQHFLVCSYKISSQLALKQASQQSVH
jgi:hypothetical protein